MLDAQPVHVLRGAEPQISACLSTERVHDCGLLAVKKPFRTFTEDPRLAGRSASARKPRGRAIIHHLGGVKDMRHHRQQEKFDPGQACGGWSEASASRSTARSLLRPSKPERHGQEAPSARRKRPEKIAAVAFHEVFGRCGRNITLREARAGARCGIVKRVTVGRTHEYQVAGLQQFLPPR